MNSNILRVEQHLPEFMDFVCELTAAYQADQLRSWEDAAIQAQTFFTSSRLESMNAAIPSWKRMVEDTKGQTLMHTVCALIALLSSPGYTEASDDEKALLEWCVLLHDIAKQTINGQRDSAHAFRSATDATIILPPLGFEMRRVEHALIQNWITLTQNATISQNGHAIQDNAKLPEIIAGVDVIFGKDQPGANIVKVVLFHHSLKAEKNWPCAAPLSPDNIRNYLDVQLIRLLGAQMLADSAAWNLFDHATRKRYRAEILESLALVHQIIQSA